MRTLPVVAVFLPLLVSPALAQGTAAQRAACMGDAFRLCASAVPNVGKIAACLRAERASISPGCRAELDKADGAPQTRTAEAKPPRLERARPAPRVAERVRPEPRVAAAPEPRATARRSAPPQRLTRREETRPAPVSSRAAEAHATPRPARVAAVRESSRTAIVRQSVSRRPYAGRARNSDYAQADYWMRRVTGFGLPAETASLAAIGPLLR